MTQILSDWITLLTEPGVEVELSDLSQIKAFRNFKHDMFLEMCVLGGCDYVDSLPGIGIKTACALIGGPVTGAIDIHNYCGLHCLAG